MNKFSISPQDLKRLIKEEASKLLREEADKIIDAGDTMEVKMNQLDRIDNSDGSAYTKNTDGKFEKKKANMTNDKLPTDVRMNQNDKDQGHDQRISAAVKVSAAGSTKKGTSDNPHIEGMKNGNFESKKGNQSVKASTPFEDRKGTVNMNSEDRVIGDGAKTYVEAGSDITGREKHTTGQKKAVASETAKNEKETYERIASGIELPESFKNRKHLLDFINENAKKASKLLSENTELSEISKGLADRAADAARGKLSVGSLEADPIGSAKHANQSEKFAGYVNPEIKSAIEKLGGKFRIAGEGRVVVDFGKVTIVVLPNEYKVTSGDIHSLDDRTISLLPKLIKKIQADMQ